jgi:cell division protein FtsB
MRSVQQDVEASRAKVQARRKKRKANKFIFRITVTAFIVFSVSMGVRYVRQNRELERLSLEKQKLAQKAEDLLIRNEYIARQLDEAGSVDFIEQKAREKLGWVRDGEILFIEDE